MSTQSELGQQFRQQQEKFHYYMIGLAVTAIGFSIYQTTGQPLKIVQIPLAISTACWGLSIFCGFMFLKYSTSTFEMV
jgi:hypothetical protein